MAGPLGEDAVPPRSRGALLVLIGVLGLLIVGISGAAAPADPQAAEALWERAQREAPDDLADPVYLDAAKAASRLRPWHPSFAAARERLRAIDRARRAALE